MKLDIKSNIKAGTNVLDIQVPDILRRRFKTNIDWFDEGLGGGFVPTTSVMLTGGPGTGKSTLMRQIADALVGEGHVVMYNTGEETLYQVKLSCERLQIKNGFACSDFVMLNDLMDYVNSVSNDRGVKKHVDQNKKGLFLFQDSLQTLDDGKYAAGQNSKTPVRCCERLTEFAKKTGAVMMFIGQCTKSGEYAGSNTIKHAVDQHVHISRDMKKSSETYGEILLEIQKNRWGSSGTTYLMNMSELGLTSTMKL